MHVGMMDMYGIVVYLIGVSCEYDMPHVCKCICVCIYTTIINVLH